MKIGAPAVLADEIKTPILVSIFRAFGVVATLATALTVSAALRDGRSIASIPVAIIVAICGFLIVLVFFGVAQLLMSIARIEFYASREKHEAILHSLHRIEQQLETSGERTAYAKQSRG